jgi:hypothetical protein
MQTLRPLHGFYVRVIAFCLLQGLVFALLLWLARRSVGTGFLGAVEDKHRLLETATGSRLIVAGGSSAAFGFDTALLGQQLGRTPINIALHAALGRDYILGELEHALRPNDLALVMLEYGLYGTPSVSPELFDVLLFNPERIADLQYLDTRLLADGGLVFIHRVTEAAVLGLLHPGAADRGIYHRNAFNAYGDVIAHRGLAPRRPFAGGKKVGGGTREQLDATLERVAAVMRSAEAIGARVMLLFPPIARSIFERSEPNVRIVIEESKRQLGENVVGQIDDVPWEDSDFYDTAYHLNAERTPTRTMTVLKRLEEAGVR